MKAACIILSILIFIAMMAVCVMVKFATDITVEEKRRDSLSANGVHQFSRSLGVVNIHENSSYNYAERFPYVAAVTRNNSNAYTFSCFAGIILIKWIVTSAHCRQPGSSHRVLLYHNFARNVSYTYPILFWRIHEKFNINHTLRYDIAVAKLNIEFYPFVIRSAIFDEQQVLEVEASVWKTLSTMDKRVYLTNDFDKFYVKIVNKQPCFETYGIELDASMICVDLSDYDDCFVQEFGPIFARDKIVGILTAKPKDCDIKLAIFTNVSFYANWILKSTHTNIFG